jgi:hypothetical protein
MSRALFLVALLSSVLAWLGASTIAASTATAAPERPLRDPFVRPAPPVSAAAVAAAAAASEAAVPPPPLRLRAVILNGARSVANIDGDIVAAGERMRDYTVLRIDAQGVLVDRAGKRQLLTLTEKDKQ